ncbi:TonB-dependent receptor [Polymorphobacter megasporae]|uniref:TonB-dependent receptor n=1 Tax=Glacieibacterium megasporae TaxID=2835787 RepID=UPI001C1E138D|nr:TonB-dependent receptor [Polymorphobacter megasporae]UAJ10786.1 TonB-dependent receptor [Polymorphobacter megasporae]
MNIRIYATNLVRSSSTIAIAACLTLPAHLSAQATNAPSAGAEATNAQPGPTVVPGVAPAADEIIVTGIRASLERSIAIKRESTGIVDAISSEDIGKFPDTNLAESLQRITGVSISRRSGEGAEVTVRGFGPQYNLVTLNGRQLAATSQQTVGGDESADFSRNTSRSFDFSNLAAEGVKTLEVYKTGRAAIPSGGIGATINVVTRTPLDARESGFTGSIGGKATYDMSSDDCVSCGSHVTPEFSGVGGWTNEAGTFGVSVFGSYQKRNFSNISATSNDWNITTYSQFIDPTAGNVNAATKITNAPTDPNSLVARPNDLRYHFGEGTRERINGQGTIEFKPSDRLDLSVDGLYAQNIQKERRSDQSNWFNRPFDQVTFDTGHSVATTTFLHEVISGETKDAGFEQQYRAQKEALYDFGAKAKWDVTDTFHLVLDGHIGQSKSTPDNPNGMSSTLVSISSPTLASHSVDYSNGFPVQTVVFTDPATTSASHPVIKGNGNGMLDTGDLGSQVARQVATSLSQDIKEARLDAGWDIGGGSRIDFGGDYRTTKTRSTQTQYQQTLGDWGNIHPGDVNVIAPGQVQTFCLVCRFADNNPQATGQGLVAFRTEDPTKLYNALSSYYAAHGNPSTINAFVDDRVKEDIWAAYGQFTWKGEIGDHAASLVTGARFESTRVRSNSLQAVPLDIRWQSDNDFIVDVSPNYQPVAASGRYNNLLPSMDFQFEIKRNLISRFSFSKTISRPSYGNLFASGSAGQPNDATAVGGQATGTANDANLQPLTSDNFDLSLEWYFKPDSYVSIGFFDKRVHNFIGNSVVKKNLFGLRDPSSGAAGSRSGTAKAALTTIGADVTDVNLFTYTALLQQNNGNAAAANAAFLANYNVGARALNQAFVDQIIGAVDIVADPNDPLFQFNVNTPVNNKDAEVYGVEVAGQYFFGNSGIGVAAAYTLVRGNVGINVAADPSVDQFALLGLSDTFNATLIYDKNGVSARLSYNWRDRYLSGLNRDASHNPEFTAPYGQLDFNLSYDITPHIAVSLEAINLNKEGVKTYARSPNEIWLVQEGQRRFLLGARYRF